MGYSPFVIGAAAFIEVIALCSVFHKREKPGQVVARLHLDTALLAHPNIFFRHTVEAVEHRLRAVLQRKAEREARLSAFKVHGKALMPPAERLHKLHKVVFGSDLVAAAVAHAITDVGVYGKIDPAPAAGYNRAEAA